MNNQSLDIGRSLSYMFEEEDWIAKFLITAGMLLISFFFVPYFIVQGYIIDIIRRVANEERPALPAWSDWGKYLSEGFMANVALFVYMLPATFLGCCIGILPAALADGDGELSGAVALLTCCVAVIIIPYVLGASLVYYAGLVRYADTGQFSEFFQFGKLWSFVRENLNDYGLALIMIIFSAFIGSFVPILGSAWAMLVMGHLLGQLLRRTRTERPASSFDFGQQPPNATSF